MAVTQLGPHRLRSWLFWRALRSRQDGHLIGDLLVAQNGQGLAFDEDKAFEILSENTVDVTIDLHEGNGEAIGWGCDLTHDYVSINADYRS